MWEVQGEILNDIYYKNNTEAFRNVQNLPEWIIVFLTQNTFRGKKKEKHYSGQSFSLRKVQFIDVKDLIQENLKSF